MVAMKNEEKLGLGPLKLLGEGDTAVTLLMTRSLRKLGFIILVICQSGSKFTGKRPVHPMTAGAGYLFCECSAVSVC